MSRCAHCPLLPIPRGGGGAGYYSSAAAVESPASAARRRVVVSGLLSCNTSSVSPLLILQCPDVAADRRIARLVRPLRLRVSTARWSRQMLETKTHLSPALRASFCSRRLRSSKRPAPASHADSRRCTQASAMASRVAAISVAREAAGADAAVAAAVGADAAADVVRAGQRSRVT